MISGSKRVGEILNVLIKKKNYVCALVGVLIKLVKMIPSPLSCHSITQQNKISASESASKHNVK